MWKQQIKLLGEGSESRGLKPDGFLGSEKGSEESNNPNWPSVEFGVWINVLLERGKLCVYVNWLAEAPQNIIFGRQQTIKLEN